jgi:hypothetical protein
MSTEIYGPVAECLTNTSALSDMALVMAQRREHHVLPSPQSLETNGNRDKAMLGADISPLDSYPMGSCKCCEATTFAA